MHHTKGSLAALDSSTVEPHSRTLDCSLLSSSAAYRKVLSEIVRLAAFDEITVLIEGESGTGKNFLARHLHDCSPRRKEPFQTVVLAALDDGVAASELFGHVSGAYTDARQPRTGRLISAARGTVLLDEIGKSSPGVQRKLLHAIEHREIWPVGSDRPVRIGARILAASNIPLTVLVNRGEFLADLYARFGFFRVTIPPLRDRRADIPELVRALLQTHFSRFGYDRAPSVDEDLMQAMQHSEWTYNIRELESALKRLLVEADQAPTLTMQHCRGPLQHLSSQTRKHLSCKEANLEISRAGSVAAAARKLGVARSTLYRALLRVEEAGIV